MNGRLSRQPFSSRVRRISSRLWTSTQSPTLSWIFGRNLRFSTDRPYTQELICCPIEIPCCPAERHAGQGAAGRTFSHELQQKLSAMKTLGKSVWGIGLDAAKPLQRQESLRAKPLLRSLRRKGRANIPGLAFAGLAIQSHKKIRRPQI